MYSLGCSGKLLAKMNILSARYTLNTHTDTANTMFWASSVPEKEISKKARKQKQQRKTTTK